MFARAGAILPNEAPRQNTNEPRDGVLVIDAFAGSGSLVLYEDAGDGLGHERGELARTPLRVESAAGRSRVSVGDRVGAWHPPERRLRVRLHTPKGIVEATVDDDGRARDLVEGQW
jgi:alpha-glucosidase (family GH31 glycosyl hydrolase)